VTAQEAKCGPAWIEQIRVPVDGTKEVLLLERRFSIYR